MALLLKPVMVQALECAGRSLAGEGCEVDFSGVGRLRQGKGRGIQNV